MRQLIFALAILGAGCSQPRFATKAELQAALTEIDRRCGGLEGYDLVALSNNQAAITVVGPVLLLPISKKSEACAVNGVRAFGGVSLANLPDG